IARHLDQLSAPDCERLFALCQDWLRQPSPLPGILEGERRLQKDELSIIGPELRKDPKGALQSLFSLPDDPSEDDEGDRQGRLLIDDLEKQYGHSNDGYAPLLREVEKR